MESTCLPPKLTRSLRTSIVLPIQSRKALPGLGADVVGALVLLRTSPRGSSSRKMTALTRDGSPGLSKLSSRHSRWSL